MKNLAYESIPALSAHSFGHVNNIARLQELWTIDSQVYEDCSIEFQVFKGWWEQYPQGSLNLYEDGRILASIGIWPLDFEQYKLFTNGEIRESQLRPVPESECDRTPQAYWYFSGIVLLQERRLSRINPLKTLLPTALGGWSIRSHVAYPSHWCALGYSQQGKNMLHRFGFRLFNDSTTPDGCPIYVDVVGARKDVVEKLKARGLA